MMSSYLPIVEPFFSRPLYQRKPYIGRYTARCKLCGRVVARVSQNRHLEEKHSISQLGLFRE